MKKAAGILVISDGKCLLCKRNTNGSLPGEWSVPAGKVEKGEPILDAARREFYEETDMEIHTPLTFVGVLKRHNREGTKVRGMMYLFKTKIDMPVLPDLENAYDGEEHTECGYFGKNELPLPMGNTFRSLISKYL
jgi:8-oxo-dGTP pyrophosphatase MutT (NUDIX family)